MATTVGKSIARHFSMESVWKTIPAASPRVKVQELRTRAKCFLFAARRVLLDEAFPWLSNVPSDCAKPKRETTLGGSAQVEFAITRTEIKFETTVRSGDFGTADNILRVEPRQLQIADALEQERNNNVFSANVVATTMDLVRHLPGADADAGSVLALQINAQLFCIVKLGPIAEPAEVGVGTIDFGQPLVGGP